MNFKEIIDKDIKNVFLNIEEFGEIHNVNESQKNILIDNDELEKIKLKDNSGNFKGNILFYISKKDLDFIPKIQMFITLDNKKYRVSDFSEDSGVYQIILEAFYD